LVIAHYSIPLPDLKDFIVEIREAPLVRSSRTKVIIYEKGDFTDERLARGLAGVARPGRDLEIVHLPHYGREGHSYLEHVTQRFNATLPLLPANRYSAASVKYKTSRLFRKRRAIADHTLFLQSHLAWSYIAEDALQRRRRDGGGKLGR
jgi:hypothetical protein